MGAKLGAQELQVSEQHRQYKRSELKQIVRTMSMVFNTELLTFEHVKKKAFEGGNKLRPTVCMV